MHPPLREKRLQLCVGFGETVFALNGDGSFLTVLPVSG
jgi:hypothetical protein